MVHFPCVSVSQLLVAALQAVTDVRAAKITLGNSLVTDTSPKNWTREMLVFPADDTSLIIGPFRELKIRLLTLGTSAVGRRRGSEGVLFMCYLCAERMSLKHFVPKLLIGQIVIIPNKFFVVSLKHILLCFFFGSTPYFFGYYFSRTVSDGLQTTSPFVVQDVFAYPHFEFAHRGKLFVRWAIGS